MGGLYDDICNSVIPHLFHGLFHIINLDSIPFQKFGHNHFAGPGTVNFPIREGISNFTLDNIDCFLSGGVVACAEADNKDCFL